jgi:hypothetical protein
MNGKKAYPIRHLVHWYYSNYCARKCFDNNERLKKHYDKLEEFANKNPNLKMTHADFLTLFNDQMTICTLEDGFKRKAIGWKLFDILLRTPDYESNNIIVEHGRLRTLQGPLPTPRPRCRTCVALGIPP